MRKYQEQKFASKLLLNYPRIWSMKLHYIIPISSIISLFIYFYEFKLDEFDTYITFSNYIISLFLIYIFYKENFYINSKSYKGSKAILDYVITEVLLYLVLMFFLFLPQIILNFKVQNSTQQYKFTEDELTIKNYTFIENKYKAKCSFNKEKQKYFFDIEGDTICYGNREILDKVVLSLTPTLKSSSEINTDNVASTIDKLSFIENGNFFKFKYYLFIIIFLVYFLIIFKYIGGLKKFTKYLFFMIIYSFIYSAIREFSPSELKTVEWSKIIEWGLIIILYYILKKQRLLILFIMAIRNLFILTLQIKDYYFIVIIVIILFISIIHQLMYLQSQPKE